MIHRKAIAALPAMMLTLTGLAMAADTDAINLLKSTGALDRLAKESGVYNASSTGKTPGFIVDPSFPASMTRVLDAQSFPCAERREILAFIGFCNSSPRVRRYSFLQRYKISPPDQEPNPCHPSPRWYSRLPILMP